MKRLLYAAAVALAMTVPAYADVVDDPLHIYCASCTATTIGTNDIHTMTSVQNFSFTSSPNGLDGYLMLKLLITDNFSLGVVQAFAASVTASGAPLTIANGGTIWDSGGLDAFLGFNGQPQNPVGAFTSASSTLRNEVIDGYYVLTANLGFFSAVGPGDTPTTFFDLNPALFCTGCLVGANLFLANGDIVATANSSFGIYTGVNSGPFCATPPCDAVAVPGPIVGAGLPGLITACFAMFGLNRLRRRRNGDVVAT